MDLSSPPMDDMDMHHSDNSNDGGGGMGGNNNNMDMGTASAVKMASNQLDSNTIRQLQQLQQLLMRQTGGPGESSNANNNNPASGPSSMGQSLHSDAVKFNKKLLDFDYGDNDNNDHGGDHNDPGSSSKGHQQHMHSLHQMPPQYGQPPPPLGPAPPGVGMSSVLGGNNITQLLQDPNVLLQLQTLQKLSSANEMEEKQTKLVEMRLQEEAFEKHLAKVLNKLPFANECDLSRGQHVDLAQFAAAGGTAAAHAALMGGTAHQDQANNDPEVEFIGASNSKMEIINLDGNDSRSPTPDRDRYRKNRRTSRSRSRERNSGRDRGRRRGSRSRSRSPRRRRNSSRDRGSRSDGHHRSSRSEKVAAEKEREAYERDRRRKGLPDIRKEHLSVCSSTLWVGHLSKLVQQEELSDTFGKFGDIVSIDMIVPRGCAFVAMNRRQDAYRAMGDLKHHKLHGRVITISWATGKGAKEKEWKDYWDVDLGVSYVPWAKLTPAVDYEALEEGGMFDEDSMPEWLKAHIKQPKKEGGGMEMILPGGMPGGPGGVAHLFDASHPPPLGGPGGLGLPPGAGLPLVPPFGLPPSAAARLLPPPGLGLPLGLSLTVPPPPMMIPMGGAVPGAPPGAPPGQPDFLQMFQMAQMGTGIKPPMSSGNNNNNGDDHMDIEDEEEEAAAAALAAGGGGPDPSMLALQGFFNRPPPLMGGAVGIGGGGPAGGAGLLGPGGVPGGPGMGLLDSMGGEIMGGRRGGERSMARGRENDRENRFDDRGRWSNNGRAMDGGRDFNNGGGGRRGQFNNNGDMFNDRRDNGAEGYERSRDGE